MSGAPVSSNSSLIDDGWDRSSSLLKAAKFARNAVSKQKECQSIHYTVYYTISIHSSIACIQHSFCHTVSTDTSVLSGLFLGVLRPPTVQIYPPISVSEAAAPPIRMMACKANLYSMIITKQLYTCKYTSVDCTIGIQPCTITMVVRQNRR